MNSSKLDPNVVSHDPIRFCSFDEISSRPKWQDDVDLHQHLLLRIIGDYSFSSQDEIRCGLKGCRTFHRNGYVVETIDGLETHIGNVCGQRHFGVKWGEIHSRFRSAAQDRDRRNWLQKVSEEKQTLMPKVRSLLTAAEKVTENITVLLEKLNKEPELTAALVAVIRNGGSIQVVETIHGDLAEVMGVGRGQRSRLTNVGHLSGIRALPSSLGECPGRVVISKLRSRALPALQALPEIGALNLPSRELKKLTATIEEAKNIVGEAETYIAEAHSFLRPSNLRELGKLPVRRSNQRIERILKQFACTPE